MEIKLLVKPDEAEVAADAVAAVGESLVFGPPTPRHHMSGIELVETAIEIGKDLDSLSVLVGYLLARGVKVNLEILGVPLTAKTLRDAAEVLIPAVRKLQKASKQEEAEG